MVNRCVSVLIGVSLLLCVGCSISGTWKTVSVEPPDMADKFMFSRVTFGEDGTYTATAKYEGQESTSTGKYEWSGTELDVDPDDGDPREYDGYLRMDGKLVLKHEHEGESMTAILQKE